MARKISGPVRRGRGPARGKGRRKTQASYAGRRDMPYAFSGARAQNVSGAENPGKRGKRSADSAEQLESELEALLFERREFPEKVLEEAGKIAQKISEEKILSELGRGRRDLRDLLIVTIDGEDTRDVDDGVSLEPDGQGGWTLGVHIADVAHYAKRDSALDREAYRRGTSVYFPDSVLPMLPKELSNGICSLNVSEDRFALTVLMNLDPEGEILSHEIFESLINVRYKINYGQYFELFEGPDFRREELRNEFRPYVGMLDNMRKVAGLRHALRRQRGSLDFEFPETKVTVADNGTVADVRPEDITFANNVIEEFMLAANETVAAHFEALKVPFIFRNHPAPDPEKLAALDETVHRFGFTLADRRGNLIPGALPAMLEKCRSMPQERFIQTAALTSMGKAVYSAVCEGHFGLAAEKYTHFTSPIRRYPDLYIHRVIKESLRGARPETLRERYTDAHITAEDSSDAEREAERAERFYTDRLVAKYMAAFLGEDFVGTVSGVTSFGLFIMLDNSAEGLLFYADMPDQMIFDPKRLTAKGRFTGRTYGFGDRVEVKIAAADEKTGRIQFQFS
ncbi:MAG: VacB/RNase II family 3'-5' exoribonuclease [Clostridia bacterium]|nr:VacB/RNase II family 3'-5' exoribonuclease [Clostridia bacterium]